MTGKIRPDGYNPIQELGLYYLQSRYYNPTWGRFINADALVSTGQGIIGNNMFAYCNNNPVIYRDSSGTFPVIAIVIVVAILAFASGAAEATMPSKEEHFARNNNYPTEVNEITTVSQVPEGWLTSDHTDLSHGNGPAANAHQFSSSDRSNVKYVSSDGKYELIFDKDGTLVTDPRDIGTYNYSPSDSFFGAIGHYYMDIKPWIRWGNSLDDTTTPFERMCGLVGIYWN